MGDAYYEAVLAQAEEELDEELRRRRIEVEVAPEGLRLVYTWPGGQIERGDEVVVPAGRLLDGMRVGRVVSADSGGDYQGPVQEVVGLLRRPLGRRRRRGWGNGPPGTHTEGA